jgi:hypothetical protein
MQESRSSELKKSPPVENLKDRGISGSEKANGKNFSALLAICQNV